MDITCAQIANYLDVDYSGPDVHFNAVSTDTRTLSPGTLFIAIKGKNFDGHDYLDQAIAHGAVGVVVSEAYSNPNVAVLRVKDTVWAYGQIAALHRSKFKIPMVGITGSCGKTTVTAMVVAILKTVGKVLAPAGSFNNEIGLPKTLLELSKDDDYGVLEMGARNPGDIKYLMELVNPNIVLINNVAPAHTETFGGLDEIAATKGEIYQYLQPHGTAILNVDDVYAPFWLSKLKTQNVLTFGLEHTADITCAYIVEEHHRIKMELVTDVGTIQIILPLLGLHNVRNALAAAAVARALDVALEDIKAGLESYQTVSRRMEIKAGKNGAKVIDDSYNANPMAMRYAVDVLSKQAGRKILVIGDMLELGEISEQSHRTLGQHARTAGIDVLLGFGDKARLAVEEFGERGMFYTDKNELIVNLTAMLDSDAVVLVKGSHAMRLNEIVEKILKD